jgi:hypothetical protein
VKLVSLFLLLLPALAVAQQPATIADLPTNTEVPASTCTEPVPPPRIQPRPEDLDRFGHQLTKYRECVEQYVKARRH